LSTLAAILRETPESPRKIRHEIPENVERVILRCMAKKPEGRYPSASEVYRELSPYQSAAPISVRRKSLPILAAGVIAVVIVAVIVQAYLRTSRTHWVESEAIPQINQLLEQRRPVAALRLFRQAQESAPSSPVLLQMTTQIIGSPVSIRTNRRVRRSMCVITPMKTIVISRIGNRLAHHLFNSIICFRVSIGFER
jgi:hypothetical protein